MLDERCVLPQVRVRGGAGSSCAGIGFNERIACRRYRQSVQAPAKILKTDKRIGAGEISGEVVQDVVPQNVSAEFEVVMAMHPGERVTVLLAMDRGLARTEGIASHRKRLAGKPHGSFGIDAVSQARLIIALITELKDVEQVRRKLRRLLYPNGVGIYVRSAGMLERAGGAAVFLCLSGETLRVVTA